MKPAGIQMGRMGAVEDRSLDVRRQQSRARDLRGIAGAGDTLGPGEFPDAFALAPASHRFPPVGPGHGTARSHVRFRGGQGSGVEDGLAPGWRAGREVISQRKGKKSLSLHQQAPLFNFPENR